MLCHGERGTVSGRGGRDRGTHPGQRCRHCHPRRCPVAPHPGRCLQSRSRGTPGAAAPSAGTPGSPGACAAPGGCSSQRCRTLQAGQKAGVGGEGRAGAAWAGAALAPLGACRQQRQAAAAAGRQHSLAALPRGDRGSGATRLGALPLQEVQGVGGHANGQHRCQEDGGVALQLLAGHSGVGLLLHKHGELEGS